MSLIAGSQQQGKDATKSVAKDGCRSKLAAQEGYLHRWLQEHKEHPYPSDEAVQKLALQSNLSVKQVQKWLENSRKRKQLM